MFVNYNDYELLYLIQDGEEKALHVLLKKYDTLIYTVVREMYPYGDKAYDLMQEGRMTLYNCIYKYSKAKEISFYSYFYICLKRMLSKVLETDYYKRLLSLKDDQLYSKEINDEYVMRKLFLEIYKNDELAIQIYDECVIKNMSIRNLAKKYNYSYTSVFRKWKNIKLSLKKYIDYL